jgi:D-sedoheptulose 7-phosphate isomerase
MRENLENKTAIVQQIEDSIALKKALITQVDTIIQIASLMTEAFRRGNKVLLFGNGGSAADAEHIACELAGKYYMNREPLPAIALSANSASLTAIANDFGYHEVFVRQLRGLLDKGDVVVGISTSGSSPNVVSAIEEARKKGAITVALIGKEGKLRQIAEYVLGVPSTDTPRIQEAHITAGHIICYLVERSLFGTNQHIRTSSNSRQRKALPEIRGNFI